MGRADENGLGPYSLGVIFSLGVLFSTFVFNLFFFMNLPVQGEPVEIAEYFSAKVRKHALGISGGILWYTGLIASLVSSRVEGAAHVAAPVSYAMAQGGIAIAALCGLFLWRELEDANGAVKIRLGLMFLLLVAGIGLSAAGLVPDR